MSARARTSSPRRRLASLATAAGALVLLLAGMRPALHAGDAEVRPRRVVLFIGDGMGISQITLGRLAAERSVRPYAFDRFSTIGLASTRSLDCPVTDSAAAATALSSGFKTRNGAIGVDGAERSRRTLLELARTAGLATGLVTTTRITHATPAGFAAHVPRRDLEDAIAEQLATSGVDVLFGGGRRYFPADRRASLEHAGYAIVEDASGLRGLDPGRTPRVAGLFAEGHMSFEIDRDPAREPSLREMTEKALDVLGREGRSYFCMIEGGRIDHACHNHDAAAMIPDQLAFADAVDAALERVERGGDLLVLVTADHATGALAISERVDLDGLAKVSLSVERFCRENAGPDGAYDPDRLRAALAKSYGFRATDAEIALARSGKGEYGAQMPVAHIVSARLGVGFYDVAFQQDESPRTHGHDGAMVPVYAAGPGSAAFAGTYENTRVAHEISRVLGLPEPGAPVREYH